MSRAGSQNSFGGQNQMKKLLGILLLAAVMCACCAGAAGEATDDPYALPLDISVGGFPPDPACVTEDGYEDESITVRKELMRYNDVNFLVVWVTIKSPTQLRTVCAGVPNENKTARPSRMAKARNAVFAINGEYYIQRDRDIFVYRQGEMYRKDPDPLKDILIIDENADFHLLTSEDKQAEIDDFLQSGHQIINAFSFGPALVKDGEMCNVREDYFFDGKAKLARMAIGQVGPLSYVAVVCQGKDLSSLGCNHRQMAEFMATLGLQSAYNLDGGLSCVMVLNGKLIGWTMPDNEREQSDIIYFASAVDPDRK